MMQRFDGYGGVVYGGSKIDIEIRRVDQIKIFAGKFIFQRL